MGQIMSEVVIRLMTDSRDDVNVQRGLRSRPTGKGGTVNEQTSPSE